MHGNRPTRVAIRVVLFHQEMDLESLEAANQSLQSDLKLAFKRIGDLQAAIEDEMESDDNEDLINRWVQAQVGMGLLPSPGGSKGAVVPC